MRERSAAWVTRTYPQQALLLGVAPRFYHGCGGVAGVDPGRGREGQAVIAQDAPQIEAGPKLGPARAERRSRLMGKKGVLVQPHGLREEGQGDGSREAREPHHRDENLPPPEHHDPPSRGQSPPPTSTSPRQAVISGAYTTHVPRLYPMFPVPLARSLANVRDRGPGVLFGALPPFPRGPCSALPLGVGDPRPSDDRLSRCEASGLCLRLSKKQGNFVKAPIFTFEL